MTTKMHPPSESDHLEELALRACPCANRDDVHEFHSISSHLIRVHTRVSSGMLAARFSVGAGAPYVPFLSGIQLVNHKVFSEDKNSYEIQMEIPSVRDADCFVFRSGETKNAKDSPLPPHHRPIGPPDAYGYVLLEMRREIRGIYPDKNDIYTITHKLFYMIDEDYTPLDRDATCRATPPAVKPSTVAQPTALPVSAATKSTPDTQVIVVSDSDEENAKEPDTGDHPLPSTESTADSGKADDYLSAFETSWDGRAGEDEDSGQSVSADRSEEKKQHAIVEESEHKINDTNKHIKPHKSSTSKKRKRSERDDGGEKSSDTTQRPKKKKRVHFDPNEEEDEEEDKDKVFDDEDTNFTQGFRSQSAKGVQDMACKKCKSRLSKHANGNKVPRFFIGIDHEGHKKEDEEHVDVFSHVFCRNCSWKLGFIPDDVPTEGAKRRKNPPKYCCVCNNKWQKILEPDKKPQRARPEDVTATYYFNIYDKK